MPKVLFQFFEYQFNIHAIPVMVVGVLIFFIGLMILIQTKRSIKDVAFFLFCMSSALWLFTMGFIYSSPDAQSALRLYKSLTFFGVANLTPNLYLFAAAASGLLYRQRYWVALTYAVTYSIYFLALTTDKFITEPTLYYWGYYPHYEPWNYLFLLTFAVVFFANQAHLKLAYEREDAPAKQKQIRLIKLSLLFGGTAFIDFAAKVWTVNIYPVGFISMFLLTSVLAYSIIRYKAFDIETVIHKTIMWVASFSIIVIPIFALYRWLFPYMKDSPSGQMLFGVSSFFIFTIYLRLIQPRVDHFFERRKANLEEISNQFVGDLVHLEGLDNLVRRLQETIEQALYPQWIDIFIYDQKKEKFYIINRDPAKSQLFDLEQEHVFLQWLKENNQIAHKDFVAIDPQYAAIKDEADKYFHLTDVVLVIPLVLNDKLLGVINLAKKANLSRYNAADIHFLTTVKNQSAIAISNSLIYQNIEEQVKERTEELVEVQKQLIQAEKLATVGTLSGGVAHEINNPLAAILTNVQMMLMFADDEDTKVDKESLELIEEATQRCRTIVSKLMTYAKKPMESDEISRVDLMDALKKVISFIRYQLEQDGVKIFVEAEDTCYPILGNNNELEQVFTNFILNARDAIKKANKSGDIHIVFAKTDKQIKVSVKDEGAGIEDKILSKIFDPFFTTKDVGQGLGLGLSICQSIVEKHQGKIEVKSAVDKGTEFLIEFPIYVAVSELM